MTDLRRVFVNRFIAGHEIPIENSLDGSTIHPVETSRFACPGHSHHGNSTITSLINRIIDLVEQIEQLTYILIILHLISLYNINCSYILQKHNTHYTSIPEEEASSSYVPLSLAIFL